MTGRNLTEKRAKDSLSRKGVKQTDNQLILLIPESHDLGNGSWGLVDYLCLRCGYLGWRILPDKDMRLAWPLA